MCMTKRPNFGGRTGPAPFLLEGRDKSRLHATIILKVVGIVCLRQVCRTVVCEDDNAALWLGVADGFHFIVQPLEICFMACVVRVYTPAGNHGEVGNEQGGSALLQVRNAGEESTAENRNRR